MSEAFCAPFLVTRKLKEPLLISAAANTLRCILHRQKGTIWAFADLRELESMVFLPAVLLLP